MSKALVGILEGVAVIALAFATGGTSLSATGFYGALAKFLFSAGVSMVLGGVLSAFTKPPRASPLNGIGINYTGTLEPRRIIYGQLKVGGMHVIPPLTAGDNNDYFDMILALAGHTVEGIDDIYLNQIRIPSGYIGAISPPAANNGHVTSIPAPPAGQVNGSVFNNNIWLRRYNGEQTTVDYILNKGFGGSVANSGYDFWDAKHIGKEIAHIAARFKYDQKTFTSVPDVTAMVRGKRVYDPRQDPTNGGVAGGLHRISDPTTWQYSQNPALCLRDYLTDAKLGLGEAQTKIDDTLVAAAANICDEAVQVPLPTLVGLTQWGAPGNLNKVFGSNSYFTAAGLTSSSFLKAPNGSMVAVASVDSDTQITLAASYGGAAASNQVTQFNTTGTSLVVPQPRYTCNTALDTTVRFEDNITQLASAMMGFVIYAGGQWQMHAGKWPGESFILDSTLLIGGISMQCATPRTDLYNSVRGNFIDPQQNYQPAEFAPIIIEQFVQEDGGETIYLETNFPCCSNTFEAQRNAIVLCRQSRNRRIVTATFGLAAYGVQVFSVGRVSFPEIGWVDQPVRCIAWKFTPQGGIELVLQEAYAQDWTDPTQNEYSPSNINTSPIPYGYLPYPPTSLTATPVPGAIDFVVTLPDQLAPGTLVQLIEYSANTPPTSGSVIATATSDKFHIVKSDQTTRYYWARTAGPNGQFSTYYPPGTGVAAAALAAVAPPWISIGFSEIGNDNIAFKDGIDGWDSLLYTVNAYNTCHIEAKFADAATETAIIGLSPDPGDFATGTADIIGLVLFGWYVNSSGLASPMLNGSKVGGLDQNVTASDTLVLKYDGTYATYYFNEILIYTSPNDPRYTGQTLNGVCGIYDADGKVQSLTFGPTTDLNVIDHGQLGDNAASQMASHVFNSASVITEPYTGHPASSTNILFVDLPDCTGQAPVAVDCFATVLISAGWESDCTAWSLDFYLNNTTTSTAFGTHWKLDSTQITWSPSVGYAWTFTLSSVDTSVVAGTNRFALAYAATATQSNPLANNLAVGYCGIKVREIRK